MEREFRFADKVTFIFFIHSILQAYHSELRRLDVPQLGMLKVSVLTLKLLCQKPVESPQNI